MNAIDTIERLSSTTLVNANLRYCLVDRNKHPFTVENIPARPNEITDFVDFSNLFRCTQLEAYAGIGISIQASCICAIDVDHCFEIPNDISSADERALYFLSLYKDKAYCEFSFSGTGLRILFREDLIDNYSDKYYIKNEKCQVEYYQPSNSYRYVTLTGNVIYDNDILINVTKNVTRQFLDKMMLRPIRKSIRIETTNEETRSFEELLRLVKRHYLTNMNFQNLWFKNAPGSGSDESERDYHLVAYLFENITQDRDMIKQLFESSNFFKTKDFAHMRKWTNQNYRYFNYLYDTIRRRI